MKRAFTIVELLVAIGLFGILLAASGMIFATAVNAHRTAEATSEITQNLAAITDQLNADFRGLRKDCPLTIWFELDDDDDNIRHDQTLFFADGDFQSYRYNPPLTGNTARVYYGQANIMDVDYQSDPVVRDLEEPYDEADILSRRQHIYSPVRAVGDFPTDPCDWQNSFDISEPALNDFYEHDNITLNQWKTVTNDPCYNNQIIRTCFDNTDGRPGIDLDNAETLHMLMARGVGHFQIQWAYSVGGRLYWWPSDDANGDGDYSDSDFGPMGMDVDPGLGEEGFGIYFNMPAGIMVPPADSDWFVPSQARTQGSVFLPIDFYPKVLKFTFILYDSKGIFKDGKTFTHIVYLDN